MAISRARIGTDSWEMEWRDDGKLRLHENTGKVIEGTEVSDAETEQLFREGNGSIDL